MVLNVIFNYSPKLTSADIMASESTSIHSTCSTPAQALPETEVYMTDKITTTETTISPLSNCSNPPPPISDTEVITAEVKTDDITTSCSIPTPPVDEWTELESIINHEEVPEIPCGDQRKKSAYSRKEEKRIDESEARGRSVTDLHLLFISRLTRRIIRKTIIMIIIRNWAK